MMNSETSSSSRRGRQPASGKRQATTAEARGRRVAPAPVPEPRADGGLRPVHLLIIAVFGAASAAALAAHGTRPANIVFIVIAIFVAGITSVAVYRTLWPLVSDVGSNQPEMLGGRTRAALEREKTIVLRAIKELEFDRAMGKVSATDCEEMIGRLRGRAVRLIRQLDAGGAGYRDLIERELNARIGARPDVPGNGRVPVRVAQVAAASGPAATTEEADRTVPVDQAVPGAFPDASVEPAGCAVCGVTNDPDARFCKSCGTKLGVPA